MILLYISFPFQYDGVPRPGLERQDADEQLPADTRFDACRAVLLGAKELMPEPAEELVCPITMCLMSDPVVAQDGHAYERRAIEKWLKDHDTSPKTNVQLPSKMLCPNHAVRSWMHKHAEQCKQSWRDRGVDTGKLH